MPVCDDEKLQTVFCGINLKNPIVGDSAGHTVDAWGLKRLIRAGCGAVITKSTTFDPLPGWPRRWDLSPTPRNLWFSPSGAITYAPDYMDAMDGTEALLNPGVKKMSEFIREAKPFADAEGAKIIGSFSPRSIEEGVEMARKFEAAGASAVHIDLACSTAKSFRGQQFPGSGYDKLGNWWSDNPLQGIELIRAVKDAVDIPVVPKFVLAKWMRENPDLIKSLVKDGRPSGLAFHVYTIPDSIWVDIYRGKIASPPRLSPLPALVPIAVGFAAKLATLVEVPIMASGGVSTSHDVVQLMMMGAHCAGVCRALYRDIEVVQKICSDLVGYISSQALNNLEDIRGIALKDYKLLNPSLGICQEFFEEARPLEEEMREGSPKL